MRLSLPFREDRTNQSLNAKIRNVGLAKALLAHDGVELGFRCSDYRVVALLGLPHYAFSYSFPVQLFLGWISGGQVRWRWLNDFELARFRARSTP